jgi:hypothetical protein
MRKSLAVVLLATGVAVGYVIHPIAATAQAPFAPFTSGETVRLVVENFSSGVTSITCTVTETNAAGFIGCAGDRQRQPRWVNLRYVQEITPAR